MTAYISTYIHLNDQGDITNILYICGTTCMDGFLELIIVLKITVIHVEGHDKKYPPKPKLKVGPHCSQLKLHKFYMMQVAL